MDDAKSMYNGFNGDFGIGEIEKRNKDTSLKRHPSPTISFPAWEKEQDRLLSQGRVSEALR